MFWKFAGELQKALSGPGLRIAKKIVHSAHSEFTRLTEEEPELVEDLDSIGGGLRVGLIKAQFSGFYYEHGHTGRGAGSIHCGPTRVSAQGDP